MPVNLFPRGWDKASSMQTPKDTAWYLWGRGLTAAVQRKGNGDQREQVPESKERVTSKHSSFFCIFHAADMY